MVAVPFGSWTVWFGERGADAAAGCGEITGGGPNGRPGGRHRHLRPRGATTETQRRCATRPDRQAEAGDQHAHDRGATRPLQSHRPSSWVCRGRRSPRRQNGVSLVSEILGDPVDPVHYQGGFVRTG